MKPKVTFFIDQEMLNRLKELSSITRVKQADYLREGVEYVLERYKNEFEKAKREKK